MARRDKAVTPPKAPKLERSSWIAGIISAVLAFVTWLVPQPLRQSDFGTDPGGLNILQPNIRALLVLLFLAVAVTVIAARRAEKSEFVKVLIEIRGNWMATQVISGGLLLLFALTYGIIRITDSLAPLFIASLVGGAALMAVSTFSRHEKGVHVRARLEASSQDWSPHIAALLFLTGCLATITIALMIAWSIRNKILH